MILTLVIIGIAAFSIILSYISLKNDMKKQKHIEEVKKDLAKGKVIFYSPSSKSS